MVLERGSAVVAQFSNSRGSYERQGTLVEAEALATAAAVEERAGADARFVTQFAVHIRELYPGCPVETAERIASHTAKRIGASGPQRRRTQPTGAGCATCRLRGRGP